MKKFSSLIVPLAVAAVALVLFVRNTDTLLPQKMAPEVKAQTAERLSPIGAVYSGSTGAALAAAAAAAAAKAATSQAAYGGTLDGEVIYNSLCTGCHTSGAGGAPMLNAAGIGARLAKSGLETLHRHAIEGFTGATGTMPARGGNPALTDEQVIASVDWMVAQSK
ncbi:hypothetical protein CO615_01440 [Lysobacteraceae bacterium NML75-0749]|nr:c-type cytochrome [Pseudomonadota bacterium]PJK03240.1 hypothetical protein CO615_01440 [Xanthomonadaceae bacterium NML75-0749]PJK03824.1 hypothetical protein CO612_08940 [Xanthomonadaceae bacterium NML71-0210]PJK04470.1 hypothetical protein CO609_05490 [Xanthomonadaceae bacterium NML91-0268]PJK08762.1 hypothetical protein CO610_04970 [Xanthomonadaceae bacterium NML95-0200]